MVCLHQSTQGMSSMHVWAVSQLLGCLCKLCDICTDCCTMHVLVGCVHCCAAVDIQFRQICSMCSVWQSAAQSSGLNAFCSVAMPHPRWMSCCAVALPLL